MNRIGCLKFFVIVFGMLVTAQATAQATRTWVSGVGDDANPCSRTAPCKTFAGAISKTAPSGEIDVLDPGGFGALTITKAITIDGSGGSTAGVLVSGTNGFVINAGSNDTIVIRNLDFNGLNTGLDGIHYISGRTLTVDNCLIYGFSQNGIWFQPSSGAHSLYVRNTKIHNNAQNAILVGGGGTATINASITDTTIQFNGRGIFAQDGVFVAVRNTISSDNTHEGFAAKGSARSVFMAIEGGSTSMNGGAGVSADTSATLTISNLQVTGNVPGLQMVSGASILSFGNNLVAGNSPDGSPTSLISQK